MLSSEYRMTALRRLLCVALVLCAVICAQTVSLAQEHSHQHSAQHCCGLCHAGPLPFMPTSMGVSTLQPSAVCWLAVTDDGGGVLERLSSTESSRAPPR
jgi:hypothetical protein